MSVANLIQRIPSPGVAANRIDRGSAPKEISWASCIRKIAVRALTDLAIAFSVTAVAFPFFSKSGFQPSVMQCLAGPLAQVVFNSILRLAASEVSNQTQKTFIRGVCHLNSGLMTLPAQTLIHESGHYGAAQLLYKSLPRIWINPQPVSDGLYLGGEFGNVCYSGFQGLTDLGSRLGNRSSIGLVSLAGPGLSLLAGGGLQMAGALMRHSHPQTGKTFAYLGNMIFIQQALYALSALWNSGGSHDFVSLQTNLGVHPIAAAASILLIPVILRRALDNET